MRHLTPVKVRFYELDPYDHVNHAVYISYFETGRVEALESIGMGLDRLKELGWQIVVTELEVRFRQPAGPGDELTVETWVAEIARASTRWSQRIVRGDEVIATASLRGAITDRSGRPRRVPDELARAVTGLEDPGE